MQNPDFVKIAEAYGIAARRVTRREDVADAMRFAQETEGPVLLEFVVECEEAVFPMVPAGADLDAMIRRPIRREAA
jgi:acetolactate synthase-1/2/3 large subunit